MAVGIEQAGGLEDRLRIVEIAAQGVFEFAFEVVQGALFFVFQRRREG